MVSTVAKMPWFHPLQLLPDNKGIFGVSMGQLWDRDGDLERGARRC